MSYRSARSMMNLLIAGIIHRTEYDVKTEEPSETAEKSASERGNASSEAHCGDKGSSFRSETGKCKK